MALQEALLKLRAKVEGVSDLKAMETSLKGLTATGDRCAKSMGGLASSLSAGGLAGAFSKLVPLLSVGGIIGLTKSALDAGDAFNDMSQRTGVSVEMLAKFKKAAALTGTSIEAVETGLTRLARNMAAAASVGKFGQMTKEDMDKAVQAVKDGERRQVEAVQSAADRRVEALQRESDQRLKEINRRYRNEERLLGDRFDDARSKEEEGVRNQNQIVLRGIEAQFSQRRRAVERDASLTEEARNQQLALLKNAEEAETQKVRQVQDDRLKAISRSYRDQQQRQQDALDDRKAKEEEAIKTSINAQVSGIKKASVLSVAALKEASDAQQKAIQGTNANALSQQMEELGLSGKAASDAFRQLGVSVVDQNGKLRNSADVMLDVGDALIKIQEPAKRTEMAMKLMGRGGNELIPMLLTGSKAIRGMSVSMTTEFAKAADQYKDRLTDLGGQVGRLGLELAVVLLPGLIKITTAVIDGVKAFNNLPGPIKAAIVVVAGLGIGFTTLAGTMLQVVQLMRLLAALQLGAALPGAVTALSASFGILRSVASLAISSVGLAVEGLIPVMAGLLSWMTGTFIPAMVAFFSGPVGWTVLAVAAVVAMCVLFREPIGKFLAWLGGALQQGLKVLIDIAYNIWVRPWLALWDVVKGPVTAVMTWLGGVIRTGMSAAYAIAYQVFVAPWVNLWNGVIRAPIMALWSWFSEGFKSNMQRAADFVRGIWTGTINGLRGIVNGFIRAMISPVNFVIQGINRLPGPDITFIPQLQIPQFAKGGVVDRPTLALIGEGGEREYVIPESKMPQAAANYLGGSRGDAVMAAPTISITTGPVMQADGQNWVTMRDLEKAMRATSDGLLMRMRSPAARTALGIR